MPDARFHSPAPAPAHPLRRRARPVSAGPAEADWLRLALVEGLGPGRLLQLLRAIGPPAEILASPVSRLAGIVPADVASRIGAADDALEDQVTASLAWLAAGEDRHLLALDDPAYPPAWLHLATPPPCVMVRGRLEALALPAIAIVGARHASPGGARSAREFAAGLATEGWAIASGLALGIDAAAHAGALEAGGPTIAFVGTGVDLVYPRRNRALAERIAATGAIVSEFPLGTPPLRPNFPRRNRLIAAHSRGVLVVEAASRSGSLITAMQALELGREVFAVPGSVHSSLSRGCHRLIREGARLVEHVDHIQEEFPPAMRPPQVAVPAAGTSAAADAPPDAAAAGHAEPAAVGPVATATLAGLDWHPASLDAITRRLPFGVADTLAALLELELAGLVERLADGRYQRRGPPGGGHPRRHP